MPWYRQYRPTTIDGLHLTSARQSLTKLLAANRLPHALLLTGPRGAGKTSTARILAAMLNDPANAEAVKARLLGAESSTKVPTLQHANPADPIVQRIFAGSSLVVQEMDAASNRGIDDVRLLKEKAYIGPAEGLVTVFILDEVHMLTAEAFNALLKLLEEPPEQVVFVLATTDVQKIPDTILSRVTHVRFSQATAEELTAALQPIISDQELTIEQDALAMLIQAADGSFRDAVKYLEQAAAGNPKISVTDVQNTLSLSDPQEVKAFITAIVGKQEKTVVEIIQRMRQAGRSSPIFHKAVVECLAKDLQSAAQGKEAPYSLKVLQFLVAHFNDKNISAQEMLPFLGLEVKALELILKAKERSGQTTSASVRPAASSPVSVPGHTAHPLTQAVSPSVAVAAPAVSDMPPTVPAQQAESIVVSTGVSESPLADPPRVGSDVNCAEVSERWNQVLDAVREQNSSIEALLRSARLKTDTDRVQIEVFYQFHREQLQQPKFRAMIDKAFQVTLGLVPQVEFILADSAKPGAALSNVTGVVDPNEHLVQLAKELLV